MVKLIWNNNWFIHQDGKSEKKITVAQITNLISFF